MQLTLSPEIDAAVDEDGKGRHLAYGSVIGVTTELTDKLQLTGDIEEQRDRDPSGHQTYSLAALALAWQPQKALQFDVGGVAGLNHASPDVELYFGVSRKF